MVIAINVKYFLKAYQQDYSGFIYECFSRLANQQPGHTFIFFSDIAFDSSFGMAENNIPVVIAPKINAGMLSGILYNLKINSLLKKYKANVLVNAAGFCSLFTKIPQCFILYSPVFLSNKAFIKKNYLILYKKCMPFFLRRVKVIVTDSGFSKNHIIQQYKTREQKLAVVYTAISDSSAAVEGAEKEKVKAQYAGENEYFIFYGDTSQQNIVLNLLKAFSQFKKWQKSGMQLLIVKKDMVSKDLIASLNLFKYRNDVRLLDSLSPPELAKVIAAAYSIIYLPLYENFSDMALQAMKCNVPVITDNAGAAAEIYGDSVLYVNFNDPANIAQKLMLLFKDEKLRQEMVEKGKIAVQKYKWEKTTELLWNSILQANG